MDVSTRTCEDTTEVPFPQTGLHEKPSIMTAYGPKKIMELTKSVVLTVGWDGLNNRVICWRGSTIN